jgi:hypothetical protein
MTPVPANPGALVERNKVIKVYYTGLNYNAVKGSRTDITANLRIGQPLMLDIAGHDQGRGLDATLPYSPGTLVPTPVGFVTNIPKGAEQGGWVEVCVEGPCLVLTNDASVAIGDSLAVAAGSAFVSDEASPTFLGKAVALEASADTNEKLIQAIVFSQAWGA